MAEALGWGILATGYIADLFTKDLLANGHRVAAVGSRSKASADDFAARFGIPTAHGSYEALVADPTVDIVYVATPHPMHHANAMMALEAGKHVLVEKPFTLNAREAEEVVDLAARKGLVVMEAMWTRFLPHIIKMREVIASGVLGEIRSVIADHTQDLPEDPAHRLNAPELGGGALLDLAIYPISLTWDIFGAPSTIQSSALMKPTGVDSNVATIFRYDHGAIAMTFSASDTAGPCTAVILGTEGRIEMGWWWFVPAPITVLDSAGKVLERFEAKVNGRGMHYQAIEVEKLVRTGQRESTIMPPAQTVAIMRCLDTVREQIGLRYPGE